MRRWTSDGPMDALRGVVAALRAVRHVSGLQGLFQVALFDRRFAACSGADPLFAISHRHFLSRAFALGARVECAASHFQFEDSQCDRDYHQAVYGGPGLELWHAATGGSRYSIVLHDATEPRHEGPVSVELLVGSKCLHVTSFAWVPARVLAHHGPDAWTLFITRNQSARADSEPMARFQADFPHNAPAYFCMAAILGLAESHGQPRIAGIRDECQVAFKEEQAHSFRRSYDDFWRSFGSDEVTSQAHLIPVPAQLPPLSSVAAKHRARARTRRAHWAQITASSMSTLQPRLLTQRATAPVTGCTAFSNPTRAAAPLLLICLSTLLHVIPPG